MSAIAIMLVALISCGRSEQTPSVTALIPADADVMARVDARRLILAAGGQLGAGGVEIQAWGDRVDLTSTYCFGYDGAMYAIARRTDADIAEGEQVTLPVIGEAQSLDEGKYTVVYTDSLAIFSAGGIEPIEAVLEAARRGSVADAEHLADFFAGDQFAVFTARVDVSENVLGEPFERVFGEVSLEGWMLQVVCEFADRAGNRVSALDRLLPYDPDVTNYFGPSPSGLRVAFGMDSETATSIVERLSDALPLRYRIAAKCVLDAVSPELNTYGICVAPGGSKETISTFSTDTWTLKALLPVPEGESYDVMAALFSSDNLYCARAGEYAAVANYEIEDEAVGEETICDGYCAMAQLTIPYGSELMKALRLPCGYDLRLDADTDIVALRLQMLGPGNNLVPMLIKTIKGL